MCSAPRANHLLRTCSGASVQSYANTHDELLLGAMSSLLRFSFENLRQQSHTIALVQAPRRYGGLGLRSAHRSWCAAYFAGWAAALPVWRSRFPAVADSALVHLEGRGDSLCPSVVGARNAVVELLHHAWTPPSWSDLATGISPSSSAADPDLESGEFAYGWQFFAADAVERFVHNRILHGLNATGQALLRSQVGQHSGDIYAVLPTQPHLRPAPARFLTCLRRRLWLPLGIASPSCPGAGCNASLDVRGFHLLACAHSGRLLARARPLERAWSQVLREAGARVREQVPVSSLNLAPSGVGPDRNWISSPSVYRSTVDYPCAVIRLFVRRSQLKVWLSLALPRMALPPSVAQSTTNAGFTPTCRLVIDASSCHWLVRPEVSGATRVSTLFANSPGTK